MMRMITVHELAGFRDALLDLCLPTDLSEFDTIDLCGTGGDGKNTFNISTLSSFVVAGAGAKSPNMVITEYHQHVVQAMCWNTWDINSQTTGILSEISLIRRISVSCMLRYFIRQ